jgi:hypothetical protein
MGFAAILACATLTSCARGAPQPNPERTLEPSITESSPMPTVNPDNPACTLLTKKDRFDLVGYSMNAELPVPAAPGTEQCTWVHSLREPARSAVRVTTLSTLVWAGQAVPAIKAAIVQPTTGKALRAKLEDALVKVVAGVDDLPTEEVCEVYLLVAQANGLVRSDQQVYYGAIGAMPAAFGTACDEGIMTIAGYGEYGLGPSLALNRGVARLAGRASERAAESQADGDHNESRSPEEIASDEDASPSPEPSPTETETSDSDGSDS